MQRTIERWKMCLFNLRAWEERQNNIPRHVRIKKLSAKAKKNNNFPLVDWREKNVSIHIYFDVSFSRTEQRPDWTTARPGAEPLNPILGHWGHSRTNNEGWKPQGCSTTVKERPVERGHWAVLRGAFGCFRLDLVNPALGDGAAGIVRLFGERLGEQRDSAKSPKTEGHKNHKQHKKKIKNLDHIIILARYTLISLHLIHYKYTGKTNYMIHATP